MVRCFLPAVAAVLTLALSSPAHARSPGHSGGMSYSYGTHNYSSSFSHNYNSMNSRSFAHNYGTKFSHGYSFSARNFYYSSRCWSSRYGCYCYWCPYVNCWYYWCAPQSCYYPISYISYAPPTVVTPPAVSVTTTVAGAPAGPGGPTMPPAGPSVP